MDVAANHWTHLAIIIKQKNITIFLNGEETNLKKACEFSSYTNTPDSRLTLGRNSFPRVAYDEIIIWEKTLTKSEVHKLYAYYKGISFSKIRL